MSINLTLMFIFLTGRCYGYTLRRDIGNIKYYCNQICKGCGGRPTLEKDVCICDFEEDTDKTKGCIKRHKSKFDFLGIKYDVSHKIKKRSIYNSKHPYLLDKEFPRGVKKEEYKYLINRTYNIPKHFYLQGGIIELPENLKHPRISPRMILGEQSKEDYKSPHINSKNSQLTQFAANMFRTISPYPKRKEEDFKMLLPRSNENYPEIFYEFLKYPPKFKQNNNKKAGEVNEDTSCDYEEISEECDYGNDYESLENLEGKGFELDFSKRFHYYDNAEEKYDWERVLPGIDHQNFITELIISELQYV